MSGYSATAIRSARSFLFVPGNRAELFAKAASSGADVVVIDLEDAVAPSDKTSAREYARTWLCAGNDAMIRINAADTPWYEADLALIAEDCTPVMVPKAESSDAIRSFPDGTAVVALIETVVGIERSATVCSAPGMQRVAFGNMDLAAQLGVDPADREAMLMARSTLVFTSAAAGLAAPIDGVTAALTDQQAIFDDVRYARRLGMNGKLCVHPDQVSAVHQASAPSDEEVAWAQKVLAACDTGGGVSAAGGQMVDLPVVQRAKGIIDAVDRC